MNILLDVYNNQDISFSELSNQLKLTNINNSFIFQPDAFLQNMSKKSLFSDYQYNNNDINNSRTLLCNEQNSIHNNNISKFDLMFGVFEKKDDYILSVEYNNNLYDQKIIDDILDSYIEVLKNVKYFSDKGIDEFNSNEYKYEFNKFYHEEFSKMAQQYPNKCIVACAGTEITYTQLDIMTNSLAHYLREVVHVQRNDIIPVICERSYCYFIGAVAVLIDPEFPKERIEYMINECNSKFILKYITNSENNEKIKFEGINQYSLDLHNYEVNTSKLRNINKYDDIAYVIFTSGTTGKPKGSLLTHNNIINYCFYSQTDNGKEIFTDQYEVAVASAKFTFDMSICEIFYSIIRNKMVVICDDNEYNDPELIAKNIMKYGVDYVFITPSRIEKYIENETYSKSIRNVKFILLGGESVNVKMIENICKHTSAVIYNVYGPTETTITCTLSELARSSKINEKLLEAVTIGKPICNSKIYILDKYLKPVPIGVEGEIYVGGYGKISEIPLTTNGKLDRRALPEVDVNDLINDNYMAPKTETEKCICEIFSEIFNINVCQIGRRSDFYELGGDSFVTIKLVSLIEKYLKIKANIRAVNMNSSVSDLAKYIEDKLKDKNETNKFDTIRKRNSKEFPVTSQQLGIYLDSIKNPNSIIYNMIFPFNLKENVSIKKVKESFHLIFESQEIFKSKYGEKELENGKTEIYGFIDDACQLEFEEYTFENVKEFVRPFDLRKAPLIRVVFVENKVIIIDMHHIISDGYTISLLFGKLNEIYDAIISDTFDQDIYHSLKMEMEIQFSDYAIDFNEKKNSNYFERQFKFYEDMFNCEYDNVNIPKNNNNNNLNKNQTNINENENSIDIGSCIKRIKNADAKLINKYIIDNGINKTSFFFSLYGFIMSKYSRKETIYTSIMTSNRSNHYIENMLGMFVSTQPVILRYNNETQKEKQSIQQIIAETDNLLYDIYNNQDISFSELSSTLKLKKVNNSFIFQPKSLFKNYKNNSIFTNEGLQNSFTLSKDNDINKLNISNNSKFDITFFVIETEDNYTFSIEYNSSIYDKKVIEIHLNSMKISMKLNIFLIRKKSKLLMDLIMIFTELNVINSIILNSLKWLKGVQKRLQLFAMISRLLIKN
eukprot:jgi/Orpsp1_1/1192277/evm.model.d7180000091961.1